MIRKTSCITLMVLLVVTVGCGKKTEQVATSETVVTESTTASGSTSSPATTPPPITQAPATQATAPSTAPASSTPAVVLSTQETNISGVTAELTEFRRRGNTLTAKVRFRNGSNEQKTADIHLGEAYVMDANAGKKYQVLKDEKGTYIGALRPGYTDRWFEYIKEGEQATIWMKFPAPPPEVKVVTLQVPGVSPFEEVTIQD